MNESTAVRRARRSWSCVGGRGRREEISRIPTGAAPASARKRTSLACSDARVAEPADAVGERLAQLAEQLDLRRTEGVGRRRSRSRERR